MNTYEWIEYLTKLLHDPAIKKIEIKGWENNKNDGGARPLLSIEKYEDNSFSFDISGLQEEEIPVN